MSDHHDFGEHDDYPVFDEHLPHEDPAPFELAHYDEHHDGFDDEHAWHEPATDPVPHHDDPPEQAEAPPEHPAAPTAEADDPVEVFPPALDVGELPEPVDGFPWIDTGSLGMVDAHTGETLDPVRPQELAGYAGTDLPPGADPWAALAGDEDPATSALARWWREN